MNQLAQPEAAVTLEEHGEGASSDWSRRVCEGAAGSSYCTYDSPTEGTMTVRVLNEAASQGEPHAVSSVKFGPIDTP